MAAAVQVRVRAIARRNSSDSLTPAAAAFSRHSVSSASLTRAWAIAVRLMLVPVAAMVFLGVEGGKPPRQPLPGITRSVAPKGRLTFNITYSIVDTCAPVSFVGVMLYNDIR